MDLEHITDNSEGMEEAGSSYHGDYDLTFEQELDQRFRCPVCLSALCEPVQTKCGHRFCTICLNGVSRNMRFARCPVDKTWFDCQKDVFKDLATEREVLSLNVACYYKDLGCAWMSELRYFKNHVENCPEVTVECELGCGARPRRVDAEQHLLVCPFRLEPCQHCGEPTRYTDLTKHQVLECDKFPVNCSLCTAPGILREHMRRHVDPVMGDCPLVQIPCIFRNAGCTFQGKRKNMNEHYAEKWLQHMVQSSMLMGKQECQLKEQAAALQGALQSIHAMETKQQTQADLLNEALDKINQQQATIDALKRGGR